MARISYKFIWKSYIQDNEFSITMKSIIQRIADLDVIFDCVGTEKSINTAIENARKGSQIIMIGVPPENVSLKLAFLQDREIDLLGSCMYVKDDYVRTIDLIHQDRIKTDPLITHSFPFDEYQKAYNTALDPEEAQKGRMKVIMVYQ